MYISSPNQDAVEGAAGAGAGAAAAAAAAAHVYWALLLLEHT